jgi:hypothetical protein
VRRQLIDHPDMLPRAVEEFLRCFSPTQALARTVTIDVEFHSCPMRQGDRVLLSWASANRDPAVFEDPDTVDIERWPNRHAAFGLGTYRCAGAHIARILARTLLGRILERMPDYVIDTERLEPYLAQGVNAGYRQIPARFRPGRAAAQASRCDLAGTASIIPFCRVRLGALTRGWPARPRLPRRRLGDSRLPRQVPRKQLRGSTRHQSSRTVCRVAAKASGSPMPPYSPPRNPS